MRHRRLAACLPLALLLAGAGCSSGSHGSAHVGSIPGDDYKTAPISTLGPGAEYEYSSGGPQTPPNGNPGPLPPSKGSGGKGGSGSGSGSGGGGGGGIRIGKGG